MLQVNFKTIFGFLSRCPCNVIGSRFQNA